LVSAFVGHGKPRRLLSQALKHHEVVASPQLLAELADVLSREKFNAMEKRQLDSYLSLLARKAYIVTPRRVTKAVPVDADDDLVLSTAYEGNASHVVSGDRHLLILRRFRGIRIVTVREMLDLL
jgi:uncharacterized protein